MRHGGEVPKVRGARLAQDDSSWFGFFGFVFGVMALVASLMLRAQDFGFSANLLLLLAFPFWWQLVVLGEALTSKRLPICHGNLV